MSKRATAATNSDKNASAQGAALDVTESFKRTRNVLSQELGRMASVTKVLDDGRTSLKTSHDEFSGVQTELAGVRKQLKALQVRLVALNALACRSPYTLSRSCLCSGKRDRIACGSVLASRCSLRPCSSSCTSARGCSSCSHLTPSMHSLFLHFDALVSLSGRPHTRQYRGPVKSKRVLRHGIYRHIGDHGVAYELLNMRTSYT